MRPQYKPPVINRRGSSNHFDAIVVGLGALGSAVIDQLSERGLSVLAIDQYGMNNERGSSHGGSRLIRKTLIADPDYKPLLDRSFQLWDELLDRHEAGGGFGLKQTCGGLYIGAQSSSTVELPQSAVREMELGDSHIEILDSSEIRDRFPYIDVCKSYKGVSEPSAGFADTEGTTRTQLTAAANRGTLIHQGERVLGISSTADGEIEVQADQGTYVCHSLVLATGAFTGKLFPEVALPLTIERQVMLWFKASKDYSRHQEGPVVLYEHSDGMVIRAFPAVNPRNRAVKVSARLPCDLSDPASRTISSDDISNIRQYLKAFMPSLSHSRCVDAKVSFVPRLVDGNLALGPIDSDEKSMGSRIFLATGCGSQGFALVPGAGEMIAQMVVGESAPTYHRKFDPQRFKGVISASPALWDPEPPLESTA